ncbi:MAG TPA: Na(+)-translocating NADH-quinone reductase subunit A [Bacteroidales bacterium]|nr:Na(+)-translocating NADH-quinone reductase subunit A [Bacteroidales bacterium]HPF04324.1 Na(+)-translocating NADH-quinone reductase subunit A [Bacteroidales bacterium]HPR12691.1 Na(+)-translocating NADH-quinone reductase subunit A [Bacteroidales bacterium]
MTRSIKLKKGLDIRIRGVAEKVIVDAAGPSLFAVRPIDFPGLIPKLNAKPGDNVQAGSPLFHDKLKPEIVFASPVCGKVVSVERGDRRKMLEVVVEKEGNENVIFPRANPASLSRGDIKKHLLSSGLWPALRQRPYHIVADPGDVPKSIFISGFDSGPLAPDYNFIADNLQSEAFHAGLTALSKLTDGRVHLVLNGASTPSRVLSEAEGVEISYFSGPHPAGNVGIHIHHLDPVNKGEKVWYINLQDVFAAGILFTEGVYRPERIIALAGSEVINPRYHRVLAGSSIAPLVKENVKPGNLRYISGNVLTGSKIASDGYLGFYDSQITVIPEGDYYEFFGWASPGLKKFSFHRTFLSSLLPSRDYRLDTNFHGGERAFVLTGKYEKVLPMDIYPMQLLKAIIAEDIDAMENLGIYEVAEEDFALCEFICPSKIEIQSVIRKGLELMVKEMS